MKIVVISGSPRRTAVTAQVMKFVYESARRRADHQVQFINLSEGGIDYFRGDGKHGESTRKAAQSITDADVWLVGSPIYNSFFSSALKNLFEYINYKETPGKTAGLVIVAAGNIGFNNVQTFLTQLMSYFGVYTNPRAVYITVDQVNGGEIDQSARERLERMIDGTLEMALKLREP